MKRMLLNGTWQMYFCSAEEMDGHYDVHSPSVPPQAKCIDAPVPGYADQALMTAGLLPDLFYSEQTLAAQETELNHYWFVTRFIRQEEEPDARLCLAGIDTVADVFVNGHFAGHSENMFIPFEAPVGTLLQKGENTLTVHILPVVLEARRHSFGAASDNALPYNNESLCIRKAAYMFGWDIFPRIVSAGIWKDVYIDVPERDEISELYIRTAYADEHHADLRIYVNVKLSGVRLSDYALRLHFSHGEQSFTITHKLPHTEFTFRAGIENPVLWQPMGLGEANLYDVTAELCRRDQPCATKTTRLGIRTVNLIKTSYTDNEGNGEFRFECNGKPFFVLGTNWVPTTVFPSEGKDRLPDCLALLKESGCNAVRCWGGGFYEDDAFYDFCDENGIAVWQDFMMGCAVYPQTPEFQAALTPEIAYTVKRLRQHPCIFLWAGDNECDTFTYERDPNRNIVTRVTIPAVLNIHDPWRPYIPSSPYIDAAAYAEHKTGFLAEDHLWGPRDYFKGNYYANAVAHFASETGYHGCPSPASLKKFLKNTQYTPDPKDKEWLVHASSMEADGNGPYDYRIGLMINQVKVLFGEVPTALSDFALASQISQSEAMKFFIERFRTGKWRRTGIIWWNLIDGWPQISDAVVDWYGCKKLAFRTIQRIQTPLCGMITEAEGKLKLVFANETPLSRTVTYRVTDTDTDRVIAEGQAAVGPLATETAALLPGRTTFGLLCITWTDESGAAGVNHYFTGAVPYNLAQTADLLQKAGLLDLSGFEQP